MASSERLRGSRSPRKPSPTLNFKLPRIPFFPKEMSRRSDRRRGRSCRPANAGRHRSLGAPAAGRSIGPKAAVAPNQPCLGKAAAIRRRFLETQKFRLNSSGKVGPMGAPRRSVVGQFEFPGLAGSRLSALWPTSGMIGRWLGAIVSAHTSTSGTWDATQRRSAFRRNGRAPDSATLQVRQRLFPGRSAPTDRQQHAAEPAVGGVGIETRMPYLGHRDRFRLHG